MWYLAYFLIVGADPVAYQHPMDFHTQVECMEYLQEHVHELERPEVLWSQAFCIFDDKEVRH